MEIIKKDFENTSNKAFDDNTEKPLLSVIVPCYNQGQYLAEAVDSALASTYKNIEIIVVNDGSTDQITIDILKTFKRPKTKILHQENKGLSETRNVAIKNSKGKYILPLDADDKIAPDFIEKSVEVLESDNNVGIVGGLTELFGNKSGIWALPKFDFRNFLTTNCLVCSHVFRKKDWELTGGYNKNMKYGLEDWDFWISIIELGRTVYQFDEITFYYRKTTCSMSTGVKFENIEKSYNQIILNHTKTYLENRLSLISILIRIEESYNKIKLEQVLQKIT